MPTRLIGAQQSNVRRIQAPERREDWNQLLRKAIAQAEASNDGRLQGLRKALADGRSETHLRTLGIIHDGDIRREFPKRSP